MARASRSRRDAWTHSPRDGHDVGILNIDKPPDLTSHDVVAQVRRICEQKRVGHAGTLDPMATGVLVVCLGEATRLVEYLADSRKSYQSKIRFGITTDSFDAKGRVVQKRDWSDLSLQLIERALAGFTGRIQQVPPMYSALKHQGQPLYRLARRGITVERKPRTVEIYAIKIMDWQPPDLTLRVDCSKGTYVRVLAHDLGQAVGPGAHLFGLTRLAVGQFRLEEAVSLDMLLNERESGFWRRHLLPIHDVLGHLPGVTVDEDTATHIRFGQAVSLSPPENTQICCAYDGQHRLIAILKPDDKSDLWRPHKVLTST